MAGSVTLSNVAEHAGVSLATASRALNGSTRTVNAELRERVLESAAALGYSANAQAQAVAKGTSNIVAVVVGDIADPYFSAIVSGVVGVAEGRGLIVTISTTGSDDERGLATVRALKGQRPRALIIAGTRRRDESSRARLTHELTAVEKLGGRVCVIGSASVEGGTAPNGFSVVPIRNRESAGRLAEALIARGYRDFCVLAGDPGLVTPAERASGFADAARDAGIPILESRIVTSEFSRNGAVSALRALLNRGERPDCIFAVTDVMAVGAMAVLREFGLEPGTDIGVAGFDDIANLQDVTPSLTTVGLPLAEIGARALEVALGDVIPEEMQAVEGLIVLRDSTPGRRTA